MILDTETSGVSSPLSHQERAFLRSAMKMRLENLEVILRNFNKIESSGFKLPTSISNEQKIKILTQNLNELEQERDRQIVRIDRCGRQVPLTALDLDIIEMSTDSCNRLMLRIEELRREIQDLKENSQNHNPEGGANYLELEERTRLVRAKLAALS